MLTTAIRRTVTRAAAMAIVSLMALSVALPTAVAASDDGCTPGYWKNLRKHSDDWTRLGGIAPGAKLSDVFAAGGTVRFELNPLSEMTLHSILKQGGGGIYALGRHTVAAMLNAANPDVDYGPSRATIIGWFNDYWDSDPEYLKDNLAERNEVGCPL